MLDDLLGFLPATEFDLDDFELVSSEKVPQPYRQLLVHNHHMTVTLEARHRQPVHLHVIEASNQDSVYGRRLFLTAGEDGPVVLVGIMRIWMKHCNPEVREAIRKAQTPLGTILVEHKVLRRLETKAFVRVRLTGRLDKLFEVPNGCSETYGRLAMIFCDEEPAVELLEVVAPGEIDDPRKG